MSASCSCEKRESGKEGVKTNECLQHEIKLFRDRGSESAVSGTRHRSSSQKCSSALPKTRTKRRPREEEGGGDSDAEGYTVVDEARARCDVDAVCMCLFVC